MLNKTIILFIIAIIAVSYYIVISMNNELKNLEDKKYNETANLIQRELKIHIDEKSNALLNIALSAAENQLIKTSILSDNATSVNLTKLSHKLRDHGNFKNIWFHIVKADGVSHYRSWTKKRGDNVKNIRLDIVEFLKNPNVNSIISVGKFDLTFKTMVPIYDDQNNFIGIFEAIAKFNSIAKKMQNKTYNTIIFVDKKYKKQIIKPFTKMFYGDYYIANVRADENSLEFIKTKGLETFIQSDKEYHIYKDANKFVYAYTMNDVENEKMAYFVIVKDLDSIYTNDLKQMKKQFIFIFVILFLLILFILYYMYNNRYRAFMDKMNAKLEEKVKAKTEEIKHLAMHDSLTSLPNRSLFLDRLDHAIKLAKREHTKLAVFFLDLDKFKQVNDTLGHEAGDELLVEVTNRLQNSAREADTVSRFGGDEFTILVTNVNENNLIDIAEKIIYSMQKPIIIMNNTLHITFSIGISVYPSDGKYSDILIRNADIAMYKAKELGKDTFQFYNKKMTHDMLERINLENNIRHAIVNQEFLSFFQPQVNAITNEVTGVEALIRWDSPELGFVSPDRFIKVAEELGLIIDIGRWMTMNTMLIFQKLHTENIFKGRLSINLSVKQLEYKSFLNELDQILEDTQFDPKLLEFEITESQIMDNPEHTINILTAIKKLGIKISIDDFGTGYSSLSYLSKLPIDKLKIDKSFVDDITMNEESVGIINSIIALSQSLHLELIAEGVETSEQKDFLVSVGCNNIQGYLYSKPLSEEDFKKYVQES